MDWLKENAVAVAALLGALYTVARLIVALTPTPKDDKALEKVGIVLKAIAKGFGLDLKQGVKKK